MTSKQLTVVIFFGALLTVSISVISKAVPMPVVDAATEAQNKPVVAPVPNGVDPSSPDVAGEPPSEVLTSTPTPTTPAPASGY